MATDRRVKIAPLFRKHLRPKMETPNLIAQLPPELRNRVYEIVITESLNTHHIKHRKGKRKRTEKLYGLWHEPPLLKTCMQIRREAAPMFYKALDFTIPDGLNSKQLPRYVDKIRSVVEWCGPKPFMEVTIHIRTGAWGKLGEIWPLLELMRTSGFEPATHEYKPQMLKLAGDRVRKITSRSSVFNMTSGDRGNLQKVLEQAVAVGRKARDGGWTQEKLASQFTLWKKKALSTRGQERKRKNA